MKQTLSGVVVSCILIWLGGCGQPAHSSDAAAVDDIASGDKSQTSQPVADLLVVGLAAKVDASRLTFTAEQAGAKFEGRFMRFSADVDMREDDLAASRIRAVIGLDSVDSKNQERDGYMVGGDFFATEKWPQGVFESQSIREDGEGGYVAEALLTLRDQTRPVVFRFDYSPAGADVPARLVGHADLKRLDFGVGQGEWRDTEWVANEIAVKVVLELQ